MADSGIMFLAKRHGEDRHGAFFLKRHASRVVGSISGFDRVLFRGVLRSISYVQGLDYFMGNQRVGFKNFRGFVEEFSAGIKARAERIAQRAGRPFVDLVRGSEGSRATAMEMQSQAVAETSERDLNIVKSQSV